MSKKFIGIDDRILSVDIYDEGDIIEQEHPANE